jgi:membrane protease YdiL (CAAX protease family)
LDETGKERDDSPEEDEKITLVSVLTSFDIDAFMQRQFGVFALWYYDLRIYVPFLALFSLVSVAVHFYECRKPTQPTQKMWIPISVLTYSTVIATAMATAVWDIALTLFAEREYTGNEGLGLLQFSLRPDVRATEWLVQYVVFLLVPVTLLRRPKRRSLMTAMFASPGTSRTRILLLSVLCLGAIQVFELIVLSPYLFAGRVPRRDAIVNFSLGSLVRELMASSSTVALGFGVVLVTLVATSEELLFRGIIYSGLREKIGVVGALVCESAMFSAYHESWLGSPLMVHFFVVGACLTWLFERTRSLYPSITVHGVLLTTSILLGFALGR